MLFWLRRLDRLGPHGDFDRLEGLGQRDWLGLGIVGVVCWANTVSAVTVFVAITPGATFGLVAVHGHAGIRLAVPYAAVGADGRGGLVAAHGSGSSALRAKSRG